MSDDGKGPNGGVNTETTSEHGDGGKRPPGGMEPDEEFVMAFDVGPELVPANA
jgi:hypothetical protein